MHFFGRRIFIKKHFIVLSILINTIFIVGFTIPDTGFFKKTIDLLESFHAKRVQEKIYLHFDKPYYSLGEDVWFKAYLTNGQIHTNQVLSSTAYVELINPDGSILETKTIKVAPGRGAGHFFIPDSLRAGDYMVRAYTNHMRNFDDSYFFHKSLKLYGAIKAAPEQLTKTGNGTSKAKSHILPNPQMVSPKVEFFPEGGHLVDGLVNLVGLKVTDSNGNGIDIEGAIENQNHEKIGTLNKTKFGIGSFKIIPNSNKKHFISFLYNDRLHAFQLPNSNPKGHILHVINHNDDFMALQVQTNIKNGLQGAYIIGHTRGIISFTKENLPNVMRLNFKIEKDNLLEGIIQLTLFAASGEPLCERLAYIEEKRPKYTANAYMDLEDESYGLRKKVSTQIILIDGTEKPLAGQFSMSVTNSDLVDQQLAEGNINTYFLLTSDLRGKIENPQYYFNSKNSDRKFTLDNLLLTQGWRRFIWKEVLNDSLPEMKFYAENGFNFSGTLSNSSSSQFKPEPGRVSVMVKSDVNFGLKEFDTDETGRFVVGGYQFYDTTKVFIQAQNKKIKKKKKNKTAEKIKFNEFVRITLDKYSNPEFDNSSWGLVYHQNIPTIFNKYLNETARLNTILAEYDAGTRTIVLEGIDIKSTKQYDREADPFYRDGNIMGKPDIRMIPDSLNVRSGDIFSNLLNRIAGVEIVNDLDGNPPRVIIRGNRAPALLLLDNVPTEGNIIQAININQIAFVDVLKNPQPIYGGRGAGGVVAVFMKDGKNYGDSYKKPNFVNLEHPGYHKIKEFYSPDYSVTKPEHKKPDLRTTLFWEPNVTVDSTGVAQVVFYTGDVETNYNIEIEGLSTNGDPISIRESFTTEE